VASAIIAAAVASSITPLPARASVVLALDLPAMTTRADRVVLGDVMSVKSARSRDGRSMFSTIEISVVELWKGEMPRDRKVTIIQSGGVIGDVQMKVHGQATFKVGERSVLFLQGATPSIVGMSQGKRSVRFDAGVGRWLVAAPELTGTLTVDTAGRARTPGIGTILPLDDFRRAVKIWIKP
jgi:hypothetical protein